MDVWCKAFCCRHVNLKTVFQNAPEHTIFSQKFKNYLRRDHSPRLHKNTPFLSKKLKNFLGTGHMSLPRPHPQREGETPSLTPSAPKPSCLWHSTLVAPSKKAHHCSLECINRDVTKFAFKFDKLFSRFEIRQIFHVPIIEYKPQVHMTGTTCVCPLATRTTN